MDKVKYHALLRGILEEPADDNARLVFADFLSDEGREEHGEFIRLQIELARGSYSCSMWMYSCGELVGDYAAMAEKGCDACKQYAKLKLREKELLGANQDKWAPAGAHVRTSETSTVPKEEKYAVRFQRGFIDYLWVTQQKFFESSADRLFSWHPVTYVRLVDRVAPTWPDLAGSVLGNDIPMDSSWWYEGTRYDSAAYRHYVHYVHPSLFAMLTDYRQHRSALESTRFYDNPAAAYVALSRACVRYGRKKNDLPDIDLTQFYGSNL